MHVHLCNSNCLNLILLPLYIVDLIIGEAVGIPLPNPHFAGSHCAADAPEIRRTIWFLQTSVYIIGTPKANSRI